MSEYQYYDFVAVDRPLSGAEVAELRALSSRATITSTRFTNVYHFGDFKGDPRRLMERYFHAHVYVANWGTRRLMLRLSEPLLDLGTAEAYCAGDSASVWAAGRDLVLDLHSEDEGGDFEDDGEGWLGSLSPVRADLAAGDLRALYLAWLLCAQSDELDEEALEPPVPPNLRAITGALRSLADYLRIDPDLMDAAATASPDLALPEQGPDREAAEWVQGLPSHEKDELLLAALRGERPQLGAELLQRYRRASPAPAVAAERRTVGALLEAAEQHRVVRRREGARREAEEQARHEREAAVAREKRLADLAPRQAQAWKQVDACIAAKRAGEYATAVELLQDLKAVCGHEGRAANFDQRLLTLRFTHSTKRAFIERLDRAGL